MNFEETPVVLASSGHRIASVAVDVGLSIVTFNIGWFIWNLIVMAKGQTPGKQLLKIRVLSENTKQPANWGHMAIRQFLIPFATSIVFLIPYYILLSRDFTTATTINLILFFLCLIAYLSVWVLDLVWLFTAPNKRLLDYWAKTIVVNEA